MEITREMIEEFKIKACRPHALDFDIIKLLSICGGNVEKAVQLIGEPALHEQK